MWAFEVNDFELHLREELELLKIEVGDSGDARHTDAHLTWVRPHVIQQFPHRCPGRTGPDHQDVGVGHQLGHRHVGVWPAVREVHAARLYGQIADGAERTGADILAPGVVGAIDRLVPERQQCVERNIKGRPRLRYADDGDHHDNGGQQPQGREAMASTALGNS